MLFLSPSHPTTRHSTHKLHSLNGCVSQLRSFTWQNSLEFSRLNGQQSNCISFDFSFAFAQWGVVNSNTRNNVKERAFFGSIDKQSMCATRASKWASERERPRREMTTLLSSEHSKYEYLLVYFVRCCRVLSTEHKITKYVSIYQWICHGDGIDDRSFVCGYDAVVHVSAIAHFSLRFIIVRVVIYCRLSTHEIYDFMAFWTGLALAHIHTHGHSTVTAFVMNKWKIIIVDIVLFFGLFVHSSDECFAIGSAIMR